MYMIWGLRNMWKGHKDETKGHKPKDQGWEVGVCGEGGSDWGRNGNNCTQATIKKCGKK